MLSNLRLGFLLLLALFSTQVLAGVNFSEWVPLPGQETNWQVSPDGSVVTVTRTTEDFSFLQSPQSMTSQTGTFQVDVVIRDNDDKKRGVSQDPTGTDSIFGLAVGADPDLILFDWRRYPLTQAPSGVNCSFSDLPIEMGLSLSRINLYQTDTDMFLYHQSFQSLPEGNWQCTTVGQWNIERAVDFAFSSWQPETTYRFLVDQDYTQTTLSVQQIGANAQLTPQLTLHGRFHLGSFSFYALRQRGVTFFNPVFNPDTVDLCKLLPNECGCNDVNDTDADGVPDCADQCPTDPAKSEPGECGCFSNDTDTDSDGVADCVDQCPTNPNKISEGECGCDQRETADSDGDGVYDCNDQCPWSNIKTTPGTCGCGTADTDTDADGTPDCQDLCSYDPNKTQPGNTGCGAPDWIRFTQEPTHRVNVDFSALFAQARK